MKTLLIAPIIGPDTKVLDRVRFAVGQVDGVEIRADMLSLECAEKALVLAKELGLLVIVTLRSERQGGEFVGKEEDRYVALERLAGKGPDWIDLEYDICPSFRAKCATLFPKVQWIASYHDFGGMPENLEAILEKMLSPYVQVYKIAVTPNSSLEALMLLEWVVKMRSLHHVVGIGMGKWGIFTRILAPVYGNFLTYAALTSEDISAPSQLVVKELKETYRFEQLNLETEVYGLLGDPVETSCGHILHNFVFKKIKKNACYVKIPLTVGEVHRFLKKALLLNFKGFSVTMPLKEVVSKEALIQDAKISDFGAVNTLVYGGEHYIGFNTDCTGALDVLEKKISVQGKKVVILGAGGVARALAKEALLRGAFVVILNRTESKAHHLAERFSCFGGSLEEMPKVFREGYDILIQCTNVSNVIDPQWILPGCVVMDTVYVPEETSFLKEAKKKGCTCISGLEMFLAQAALQQKIWSGKETEKYMREALSMQPSL